MAKKTFKQFEKSKFDNDRGVKEGSAKDKAKDKGQFAKFKKSK